jgi:CheY-like chemotaxis protein
LDFSGLTIWLKILGITCGGTTHWEDFMVLSKVPTALVVDDNRICRIVAVAMLERLGFFVVVATNGSEALAATADTDFQVILMDCDMPVLDGLNATLAIRQLEQQEHILIIGVTSRANREECLAVGMDDHLVKPLTTDALGQLLRRWGMKPARSDDEKTTITTSLRNGRVEMDKQAEELADQHKKLDDEKNELQVGLWTGTSTEIATHRSRLDEREISLQQREWALFTRQKFLERRERHIVESIRFGT